MKKQAIPVLLGLGVLMIAWGGLVMAARLVDRPSVPSAVPDEFKGIIPDPTANFLFADLKGFAERIILRSQPDLVTLQCFSVVSAVSMSGHTFDRETIPRSLTQWRELGILLWEHNLLNDVSGTLPPDIQKEGVFWNWLKSAAPGSFYVYHERTFTREDGTMGSDLFRVGCKATPSLFNRGGHFSIGVDAMPPDEMAIIPLLPAWVRTLIETPQKIGIWYSRAWQLRCAYSGYVLTKKKYPSSLSDFEEVMGKALEPAWKDPHLKAYAEKYFLPAARKGFEEAGFTPAGP